MNTCVEPRRATHLVFCVGLALLFFFLAFSLFSFC